MSQPRQWAMYAQHRPDLIPKTGREFLTFGGVRYVQMHGDRYDIVPVILTEDEGGEYFGWIDAKRGGDPVMVQPSWGLFTMQFPYGPAAEQKRGHGEIVRLRVDLAGDEDKGTQEGCGYSYDHDLKLIGSADGITTYECRECGAEVVDDENADG
jgi:hypothetical protein